MKYAGLIFLLASLNSFALDLTCELKYNSEKMFTQNVSIKDQQRNLAVGIFEEFKVILSSNKDQSFELQVYNEYEPSRTYSTGRLDKTGAFLDLAVWRRDYLLEVRCTRN